MWRLAKDCTFNLQGKMFPDAIPPTLPPRLLPPMPWENEARVDIGYSVRVRCGFKWSREHTDFGNMKSLPSKQLGACRDTEAAASWRRWTVDRAEFGKVTSMLESQQEKTLTHAAIEWHYDYDPRASSKSPSRSAHLGCVGPRGCSRTQSATTKTKR